MENLKKLLVQLSTVLATMGILGAIYSIIGRFAYSPRIGWPFVSVSAIMGICISMAFMLAAIILKLWNE